MSYVIVGAGISGLYTAYTLLENDKSCKITILAKYMPGDQSIMYTSPAAGGNFSAISGSDPSTLSDDKYSYTNLHRLKQALGENCGLERLPSTEFWDFEPPAAKIESLKSFVQDFRIVDTSRFPDSNVKFGVKYTTWNFNCPSFLQTFANYLKSRGVRFDRRTLTHISQAWISMDTTVVFNCTGLGARSLGGIEDKGMTPTRGQVVIVRSPQVQQNMMRWGRDYATYIIPRPGSGGAVVLGGFLQKDNWSGDTYGHETTNILERTTKLLPALLDNGNNPAILREAAGLRPSRFGGVRIEAEEFAHNKYVVHNYGASGNGYQSGLGMARRAVDLALGHTARAIDPKL